MTADQGQITHIVTPAGFKQTVCSPSLPQYDQGWFSERERYLLEQGWEKDTAAGMPTYRDPKGSQLKGEMRVVGELPVKGDDLKKTEPLRQFHVPPATYNFTLEEALDIQMRRDAQGDSGPSLQDRLGECEQRCNKVERELLQFRARVRGLLTTPQLSFEGMKLGLRELIGE